MPGRVTDPNLGSGRPERAPIRIYLARHGRTPLNAAGALRGHLDPVLDSVGQLEASNLGNELDREKLGRIISSPLKRAVATASEVARRAGLEVEIDRRFIDRDYGPWAGRTKDEVIAQWGSLDAAPEVEPELEVLARSMDALNDACRHVSRGPVLVVSHDAVNRSLLTALDKSPGNAETLHQDTGCFNVLERRGEEWSILSVNNTPSGDESAERRI
jgi:broad specificity phosphatase PhoE